MKTEEHNLQVLIINLLRYNGFFCFAIPNGGKRSIKTAVYLKKEGTLSGVSDLIILLPQRCVFIEVKTAKGRQSDSQIKFEKKVIELGFEYEIWRTLDDCHNFIKKNAK